MKAGKPFFFRIELVDLMDFATEPEGSKMSLLEFAKELKKGSSKYPAIQSMIEEAEEYIAKKAAAGKKGMENRWLKKESVITDDNGVITSLQSVITRSRSRNRSSTEAEALKSLDAGRVQDKPSRAARSKKLSDEEMMQQIRLSPIYQRIDVDGEYIKMKLWCQNKGKIPTMSRVDFLDSFVGVVNQAQ